jgi:hypothetical protein
MNTNLPRTSPEPPGLPPVSPPTGKFLMQLFLVPGLIVVLVVGLLLFIYWLINGPQSPESYLKKLDDLNAEVRWRAAADLAQVLPRDTSLASDAAFALQLADRLHKVRAAHAPAEAAWAARAPNAAPQETKVEEERLNPERNQILYLASSLSRFKVPAGVFALKEMAVEEGKVESKYLAGQRRQAVWLLANLGESVTSFDQLGPFQQAAVLRQLETAADQGPRPEWARVCLKYLHNRQAGKPDALGVDQVLIRCATDDDDPALRAMAAFAMNFWTGTAKEEEALEEALVRLSHDDGRGEAKLKELLEEDETVETRTLVKRTGYQAQVNATIALARRGSTRTRIELLEEMLDPNYLRQVFLKQNKQTGEVTPDEAVVIHTVLNALKALTKLHEKRPDLPLRGCPAAVDKLVENENISLHKEARQTQNALNASR